MAILLASVATVAQAVAAGNAGAATTAEAPVELVHADAAGRYFEGDGPWDPRIVAELRTGVMGRFG